MSIARIGRAVLRRLRLYVREPDADNLPAPIFVLGANRSGTSVLTSLIAQHPAIEGLFTDPGFQPDGVRDGHYGGFDESLHVWSMLNGKVHRRLTQPSFFGHPQWLSLIYRTGIRSPLERRVLRNALLAARNTDRVPLLKDQFNMLRIGLVKQLFPAARFVFILRDWPGYVRSNRHKWHNEIAGPEAGAPQVGLHWMLLNAIAQYDLERYAPNDYCIVQLTDLESGQQQAQQTMGQVFRFLGLDPVTLDLAKLDPKYRSPHGRTSADASFDWSAVGRLAQFERRLIESVPGTSVPGTDG